MLAAELKTILQQVAQNDYQPPETPDVETLVQAMLQHIGSLDATLRDELIYSTLARWIMRGVLADDFTRQVLHTALDDQHLHYRLGERDTDSVFTRSFSALLLPVVLIRHREQPFLPADDVHYTKERLLQYYRQEQDTRGYTGETGWAHAVAHGADALDDLAQAQEISADDLMTILDLLRMRAAYSERVYDANEEDRMAYAAVSLLLRQALPEAAVLSWIGTFREYIQRTGGDIEKMNRMVNAKHFLRGVYFLGLQRGLPQPILNGLVAVFAADPMVAA